MKKYILLALAFANALLLHAQDSTMKKPGMTAALPQFSIDLTVRGGTLEQDIEMFDLASYYPRSVNADIGKLTFQDGKTYGADIQLGYFFSRNRHIGVGLGLMYLSQSGTMSLDRFHMEYLSYDYKGDVFRQVTHANSPVREELTITNINVPLVMKYQTWFTRRIGFTVDAGLLYSVRIENKYTADAVMDYEAIYRYELDGTTLVSRYDPSPVPQVDDWLITQDHFTSNNPDSDVEAYFAQQGAQGYNVGLNVSPDNKSGGSSYKSGALGFIVQPAFSFLLTKRLAVNVGGYYLSQTFVNDADVNYRLTDQVGSYTSVSRSIKKNVSSSYGGTLGFRFYFGQGKDSDKDGVPDRKDACPDIAGLPQFDGCPDTDGDGIPDASDASPEVAGLPQFNGSPDTDGDGVQDELDECFDVAGPASLNGCPDTDKDGVPDVKDDCPDIYGDPRLNGCPDRDGDGVPDNKDDCADVAGERGLDGCPDRDKDGVADKFDNCPDRAGVASNGGCPENKVEPEDVFRVKFGPWRTSINKETAESLDKLVAELVNDPATIVYIEGHADISGEPIGNMKLSKARALAVRDYILKKGIEKDRVKTTWYGDKKPAFTNETFEGRSKNRRVSIRIEKF